MNRAEFPEELRVNGSGHERTIEAIVSGLITRRGYDAVIYELVATVYNLGQISFADPENTVKKRDFSVWARAVRSAILQHEGSEAFDNNITNDDRQLTRQMGIKLD